MTIETWPGAGPPVHGAPSGGPARYWFADELVVDANGAIWKCTVSGRPGTWVQTSADSGASGLVHLATNIAFNTAGLLTGVTLYTPAVGDFLLDAWIEVVTAWDGTTPLGNIGNFVGTNHGFIPFNFWDMTVVRVAHGTGFFSPENSSAHDTMRDNMPGRITAANPIKVCVTQTGDNDGADPGATQGAAIAHLLVIPA